MPREGKLKKELGLFPVVLFGLAYMVPLTIFTTYGIVEQTTRGMLASAYVVTLVTMLFTAYSYGRMAKVYPYAGTAYTYSQKSLNSHIGFLTGWVLLLDYLFLPMLNYMLIGVYLSAEFPSTPGWLWTVLAILCVTLLNVRGIKVVTSANFLLILFQTLFLVLFISFSIKGVLAGKGAGEVITTMPFFNSDGSISTVFSGAAILALSFLGFDAVTTLSEETIDAQKTIPKAIFLVTIIGGGMFVIVAYFGQIVHPDYLSYSDPESAGLEIMGTIGGGFLKAFFLTAYIGGCLASATSSHASVSRLLYSMGRDSIFPKKVFGHISLKYNTPTFSIIAVSIVALSALLFSVEVVSSFISFGALTAFTLVHLSVISHFYIKHKRRSIKGSIFYLVIPLIGTGLCIWLWTSLSKLTFEVGVSWLVIGIIYLTVLTKGFKEKPPELSDSEAV